MTEHLKTRTTTDIAVIGAGPTGLSMACALANSGLSVTVMDSQNLNQISQPAMDGRDIALTHMSRTILEEMNVWQRIAPEDVHSIREATVQNGDDPYALLFERSDNPEAPLGYLVANHRIRLALYEEALQHQNIHLVPGKKVSAINTTRQNAVVILDDEDELEAALVLGADSRFSVARQMMGITAKMKDFGRVMIVCNMQHQHDHGHVARECFHYGRTCAVLPLGVQESSVVITVRTGRAGELLGLSKADFNGEATQMLGNRLGKMELTSERFSYPLIGVYSDRFIGQRFALIGDAAVGMHPVTAHGYNLGLRSTDILAAQILGASQRAQDIGSATVLRNYEIRHQLFAKPLYEVTNLIVGLYNDEHSLARIARNAVIRVGNNFTPFKKLVTNGLTQTR